MNSLNHELVEEEAQITTASPETSETVDEILAQYLVERKAGVTSTLPSTLIFLVLTLVIMAVAILSIVGLMPPDSRAIFAILAAVVPVAMIAGGVAGGATWLYMKSIRRRRKPSAALKKLVDGKHASAIGPLMEQSARNMSIPLAMEVIPTVAELLPSLRAEDYEKFTNLQRNSLLRLLRLTSVSAGRLQEREYAADYARMAVAMIQKCEEIGIDGSLPVVTSLTNMRSSCPFLVSVRQAAIESLPALRVKLAESAEVNRLLRPAEAPDTLLRPASPDVDEKTLLRPVDPPATP